MLAKFKVLMVTVLLLMAAGLDTVRAQQLDSTVRVALDSRLSEYFAAIEREGATVQKGECDFLIETCSDSLMRQHVALTVYEHYRDSKVMGSEAVAIHVFDKWFASGKVKMRGDTELLAARIFAEFNRQSLIGNKAPELLLYDIDGNPQTLFDKTPGRYTVLFFYDTSCATCKLQTILLSSLFQDEDFPVDFVAVYASDDMDSWKKYAEERLDFGTSRTRVSHLWDPEISSDFQRKYGVVQTPRMFLINPEGIIIGRSLDAQALSQLLHAIFDEIEYEYGSDDSIAMYDSIFGGAYPSADDVIGISEYISSAILEKGDTAMYKQMAGDLLYYLTLQRGEGFKEGLAHLISDKVLSRPDIWNSSDDTLKVVGLAQMYDDLLSKSTPGKRAADMKLPGTLLTSTTEKTGSFRLRKLGSEVNHIMFVTDGCHICAAEKEAARRYVSENNKSKVLMVNVDEVLSENPELASAMFDSFDLSTLPFILETDRKGKIIRRYISFLE